MADGNVVKRLRRKGRVELTWTNKDWRLLAREDGTWDWVPQTDYRVAEVRLLREAGVIGDADAKNLLIHGDPLYALRSLMELPQYAGQFLGRVKLAYLDPPFNTQQAFEHYDDALEHSVWLTMMRDRFETIRDLLSDDGSIWVHLDDVEVHRCRSVLDEVFGPDNFVASVIWEKTDSPRMDAKLFSVRHDTILVYRKTEEFTLNRLPATDDGAHYNKVTQDGRRYMITPLRGRGGQGATREARPNLYFAMIDPDGNEVYPKLPDGRDGAWRWGRDRVERDSHLVEWVRGRKGWTPWYRTFQPDERFRPVETIWPHKEVGSTRTSAYETKRLFGGRAFATPKPERLLQRIIYAGTNEGDIVLDCFLGSATTSAVAHKMRRRFVGIEWNRETVEDFAIPRMTQVVQGEDEHGITESEGWAGGGGFRVLEVAPSMFEDDDGQVVLAEWATNGALSEATAAQLHFTFELQTPFCGRKGRTRLAVIDGHISTQVVELLIEQLDDAEKVVVCGTSIDPQATEDARELRTGSRVRKIPDSLLADYQEAGRRLRTPNLTADEPSVSARRSETVT